MARINSLTNFLNDVSSAIKQKTGDNTPIPASEFDTEILSIETAGIYQQKTLTITQNGQTTLTPDTGFDAMDQVVITVNVPIKQLQSKTVSVTSNGNVTLLPDTGYDGFNEINLQVNVSGGSGDVKLFETEQAMQADPNPSEGDLAVVYRNDVVIPSPGDTISSITPPNTVVFDTAITSSATLTIRDMSVEIYLSCRLNASQFYISDMYGTIITDVNRILYTSSDGITYTRTDGGANTYDLGAEITISSTANVNILQFLQSGGMVFEGLYEYDTGTDTDISCLGIKFSDLYPTYNQNVLYQYNSNLTDLARLNEDDVYVWTSMVFKTQAESNLYYGQTLYKPIEGYSPLNNTNVIIGQMIENNTNYLIAYMTNSPVNKTLLHYTGSGFENVNILANEWQSFTVNSSTYYYKILTIIDPTEWVANYKYSLFSMGNSGSSRPKTFVKTGSTATMTSGDYSVVPIYGTSTRYFYAPTQLTLSSSNQLLADITGYGKNGIVTGDGTVLDNFTLYEFINSNIGEPYDIKTLHNSKIIYKNGSNNYNKTLLKHKTFDGTGICMFEKLNPLENAIGSPSAFVKYTYGYVLIKVNDTNTIFTFVYYDNDFNYRNTQTVNVSKAMYVDGRAVNWYEDNTGLYCLLSPISNTTDIGMLHILDTTATIKLSTKTGTYSFNWGRVTSDHYGISVSGTYSSSKYTLYINKYNYSTNTVTSITTLSNISLSSARTSFAEDADNVYVCIGNSSYTASSTYQNCKVYVISKSTYTVSKTIDTGSKYAVFTSASDTAPCLVIVDSSGNATVNLMVNGDLEYQHNIARPTIEFYYWSKYISNKQSLYITGGGYSFGYVNICTPTENNIVLPNIEWWSDTGNTYSSSLFSSAQPYDITENTIDIYTFTSTADFYHIHVDLTLDVTNTNEGEFILPISDKTKSYMAYAYFGYTFDNNSGLDLHVSTVHLEGWVDPSTDEETDVWYLGGLEDIDYVVYLTTLHAYNSDGVDIADYVKWEVQITNNGTIPNIDGYVNFGMGSYNDISFQPAANVSSILIDDWFIFKVKCTDVYGNVVYSNELQIENSSAPDNEPPEEILE